MKYLVTSLIVFTLFSCGKSSEISKDFNCNSSSYSSLKEYVGFKKNFKMKVPSTWQTNYYYDNVISSIYAADTTLSLTQATMIDASYISSPINIDEKFISKIKADNTQMELHEVFSKKVSFLDRPSYYNLAVGKRGNFDYRILNIFTKHDLGFLHIKTEVYGDSLADERICKAINLLNNITFN